MDYDATELASVCLRLKLGKLWGLSHNTGARELSGRCGRGGPFPLIRHGSTTCRLKRRLSACQQRGSTAANIFIFNSPRKVEKNNIQ